MLLGPPVLHSRKLLSFSPESTYSVDHGSIYTKRFLRQKQIWMGLGPVSGWTHFVHPESFLASFVPQFSLCLVNLCCSVGFVCCGQALVLRLWLGSFCMEALVWKVCSASYALQALLCKLCSASFALQALFLKPCGGEGVH